jgi:ferredoxin/flavodoxin---NADP+ reductase
MGVVSHHIDGKRLSRLNTSLDRFSVKLVFRDLELLFGPEGSIMAKILENRELTTDIYEVVVEAPEVAGKAHPGEFLLVMADEKGERIPLTIADFNAEKGTLTMVIMALGTSTRKLVKLQPGQDYYALIGPLGVPSEIENFGTVLLVAGGVGTAPIYPIARGLKEAGNKVIAIQGARNKDLLFWSDRMREVCDELIITTDDGSEGRKGLVTAPLQEMLEADKDKKEIGVVYAIGPTVMMKFCAQTTRPYGVKTVVSLNSIMVDGTGMCGGCRVTVGDKTLFTCVDGPEFDGHQVDWDQLITRLRTYHEQEKCSLDRYVKEIK